MKPLPFDITEDMCAAPYYVKYQSRAKQARMLRTDGWEKYWDKAPTSAAIDTMKIGMMLVDCQGTFCYPLGGDDGNGELFVGGRSGKGAILDNQRLASFILRWLPYITGIHPSLDTHRGPQIFHEVFLVCGKDFEDPMSGYKYREGDHPLPMTFVSADQVLNGTWGLNPDMAWALTGDAGTFSALKRQLEHYVNELAKAGKYQLTIWPYHAMLGSPNHALVSAIEEVCFFHSQARGAQTQFGVKGGNPLTENYSILRPEVLTRPDGSALTQKNVGFIKALLTYDVLFIAGQAKSHCVAWTIDDLLSEINAKDSSLAERVYLLEDCTSPVVVPGIVDFTDQANEAFDRFKSEGMNVVLSTTDIRDYLSIS